jgi:alpha-D-ribose 1-methylphosphonate 5-triphosphate synthase subunit PhnG
LPLLDVPLEGGHEVVQVDVYRGIPIGLVDVDGIPESEGFHFDVGDITIGRRIYGITDPAVGFDVEPHVEVIGP